MSMFARMAGTKVGLEWLVSIIACDWSVVTNPVFHLLIFNAQLLIADSRCDQPCQNGKYGAGCQYSCKAGQH